MKLKNSGIPVFGYEGRKSIRRESFAEHFGQECQPNVLEQLLSFAACLLLAVDCLAVKASNMLTSR